MKLALHHRPARQPRGRSEPCWRTPQTQRRRPPRVPRRLRRLRRRPGLGGRPRARACRSRRRSPCKATTTRPSWRGPQPSMVADARASRRLDARAARRCAARLPGRAAADSSVEGDTPVRARQRLGASRVGLSSTAAAMRRAACRRRTAASPSAAMCTSRRLYHLVGRRQARASSRRRPACAIPLSPQRRWLVIPGSAGQPRDGEPGRVLRAVSTTDSATLTFHRVPYDHDGRGREDARRRPAAAPGGSGSPMATEGRCRAGRRSLRRPGRRRLPPR